MAILFQTNLNLIFTAFARYRRFATLLYKS